MVFNIYAWAHFFVSVPPPVVEHEHPTLSIDLQFDPLQVTSAFPNPQPAVALPIPKIIFCSFRDKILPEKLSIIFFILFKNLKLKKYIYLICKSFIIITYVIGLNT
jgi:hypothetical protein